MSLSENARRKVVVSVACTAAFVVFLDTTIVNVAFPSIERSFKSFSRADVALTLTAYATILGALLIPGGRIADYIGSRTVFLGALCGFAVCSGICGLAPSLPILIGGRVLQAGAAALMAPASLAVMFSEYPEERRTYVVGIWSAAAGAATALGPAAGGLIVNALGWRYVFLVNLPIGLFATFGGWAAVKATARYSAAKPGIVTVGFATAAAVALTTGLFGIAATGKISSGDVALFVGSAALASACVLSGRRSSNPLVGAELLHPRVLSAGAATFFTSSAGFALLFVNVLYLSTIWHYDALTQGLAVTPGPIVTAAIVLPASKIAERYGAIAVALPGVLLLGAGAMWFHGEVGMSSHWMSDWLPGAVLTGAGIGLSFPTIASAAISFADASRVSTAVAVNGAIRQIGAVAGISAVVCVAGRPGGAQAADLLARGWVIVALMSLLGGFALLPLARTQPTPG
jgi:MFS family permease